MSSRFVGCAVAFVLLTAVVDADAAEARVTSTTGLGAAYLGFDSGSGEPMDGSLGVAIDLRVAAMLGDWFGVNFLAGLGFTELERTRAMADWGVRAGRWSTNGFRSVARWVGGPQDTYYLLKCIPAFFAYAFLAISYVAAGVAFVLSPLASMSYALAGPTGSVHFGGDTLGGFVEAGIGGMLTAPGGGDRVGRNYGPLFGIGGRLGPVGVGARVLWSPRGAHDARLDNGRTDVVAASLTLSLSH